jgi:hypothetical protein
MIAWSGSGLYFRDKRGVEVWRGGTTTLVLPGVSWIAPRASPGTQRIVYETKDSAGVPGVFVLDPATGSARKIASLRSNPVLLNPTTIWYRGDRMCHSGDKYPCGGSVTTTITGETFIYNMSTGVESQSLIQDVWDVWPHAA